MRTLVAFSLLLLTGCEYSLRIPFPKVEKYDRGIMAQSGHPSVSVQPSNPALGETVTITYTSLEPGFNYAVYLSPGETGVGDPDTPDPNKVGSYFKVGNLVPIDKVASVSFDVRLVMGNDQNGDPFKLSRGQLVTITLKGHPVDRLAGYFMQSGGAGSFLIQ